MTTISKPNASPIAAALLTWFVFGIGHIVINGQTNKWIWTIVLQLIGTILCVIPGIIVGILSIIDAYQTAERLQKGETIGENEYSNKTLYSLCKMLDKKATCKFA